MAPDSLLKSFRQHHENCEDEGELPVYWLSVNSVPETFVDDLARIAQRPNDRMRVTTVEAIRSAGFIIEPTLGDTSGHCDVWLATGDEAAPPWGALERLSEAFSEPVPNPGGKRYQQ